MAEDQKQQGIILLNISDFNNTWNRQMLDRAWRERSRTWQGQTPPVESSPPCIASHDDTHPQCGE